jgi:hypothetical protein
MLPSPNKWTRPAFRKACALLSCIGLLLGFSSTFTPASQGGIRPYSMPQNLLQYFQGEYPQIDSLDSSVQQTSDGPLGQIGINGAITMSVDVTGMSPDDAARAVAMAFFNQEAAFFDLPSLSDLHELSLTTTEDGITVIQYSRYIGQLPFVDEFFRVEVNGSHAITRVEANLAPVSAALTSALGQTTLTSDAVKAIVRNDLVRSNQPVEPALSEPAIGVTWRPPYVVWGARGSVGEKPAWGYSINAITGEILNKACTAISVQEADGGTPCE